MLLQGMNSVIPQRNFILNSSNCSVTLDELLFVFILVCKTLNDDENVT